MILVLLPRPVLDELSPEPIRRYSPKTKARTLNHQSHLAESTPNPKVAWAENRRTPVKRTGHVAQTDGINTPKMMNDSSIENGSPSFSPLVSKILP